MSAALHAHMELIRGTRRCRDEVLETADKLAGIGSDEMMDMAREFISKGEDSALGILMNVCAIGQIRIPPELLPSILEVIEPIIDFGPLLAFQDAQALPYLLESAKSEAISFERQTYAGLLSAEMSLLHGLDPAPVRHLLRILEQSHSMNAQTTAILGSAFMLLDMPEANRPPVEDLVSQARVIDLLPDKPPPIRIGDGGTVRRPVPKIGRNAPCPCGSGKKYKKCCMGKDHQRIRDASSHEGLTRSQILAAPDLVDDVDMIEQLRAYDLKKLDPARLNMRQLIAAYRRCDLFGMRELAFAMLLEIEGRPDNAQFDRGHFFDLLDSALNAGDLELAERVSEHAPWEEQCEMDEAIVLHLELLRHGKLLEALNSLLCREMATPETYQPDPLLLRLSHGFQKNYPALGIAFARAYIVGNPDQFLDNETLLSAVRGARAELNVDSWGDPIEDYVEWCMDREMEDVMEAQRSDALRDLSAKLEEAREKVKQGQRELLQKEHQLEKAAEKLKKQQLRPERRQRDETTPAPPSSDADRETITRLRSRITALKAEIGSHQQIRRDLRKELQLEREKTLKQAAAEAETPPSPPEEEPGLDPPKLIKKILIPEYFPEFQRALAAMPTVHAAKALKAVAEFSAGEEKVWRQTKPIKQLPGCFRIRIGRDYRLMLDWQAEETLRVLDCIHRSELESWIHRRTGA